MSSEVDGPWAKVHWRDSAYDVYVPNAETDYIQGRLLKEGTPYEEGLLAEFSERVGPGDLALDVGANVGNHALFMACVLGCKVEAFEPDGNLVRAIEVSLERNQVQHLVRTHRSAVGAGHGHGKLVCDDPTNLGGQRVVALPEVPVEHDGAPIEILALDDLAFEQPVRLVKIDVEGAELDVLGGAAALLERDQPLVYVECLTDADFTSAEAWLGDRGYVWVGVWNASPTHCFVHRQQVPAFADLRGRLREVALAHYGLTEQVRAVQQQLDRANLMYRALAQQVGSGHERGGGDLAVVLSNGEGLRLQVEQLTRDLSTTRTEMARRLDMRDSRLSWARGELHKRLQESAESVGALRAQVAAQRDRAESALTRLRAEETAHAVSVAALGERSSQLDEALTRLSSEQAARAALAVELEERTCELQAAVAGRSAAEEEAGDARAAAAALQQRMAQAESNGQQFARTIDGLRSQVEAGINRHDRVRQDLRVVRQHIENQRQRLVQLTESQAHVAEELQAERSRSAELEARIRADLQSERARHEAALHKVRDDLRLERARHQEVEAQLHEELRVTRNRRDTYRRNLIDVRSSATYILGAALREAVRSPRGLMRLLPELRRAYRSAKEQRR